MFSIGTGLDVTSIATACGSCSGTENGLWWIGLLAGVHPALVTYWFYEDDIPLMERNFGADSMAKIRASRDEEVD